MHLDTVCTMVDVDAVVMYPNIADALQAYTLTPGDDGEPAVAAPEPFLVAAAKAMHIDTLRVIDTGLDPITAEREQWDDGNNTLCLAPRLAVAYERNTETNARLGRRASRWSGSPGPSWGAGAAVRGACPARSSGVPADRSPC
jgi:arginine deiminase